MPLSGELAKNRSSYGFAQVARQGKIGWTQIRLYSDFVERESASKRKPQFAGSADGAKRVVSHGRRRGIGTSSARLMSDDECESEQETLFWLTQPNIEQSIDEAKADIASRRTLNESQVRRALGLKPRST